MPSTVLSTIDELVKAGYPTPPTKYNIGSDMASDMALIPLYSQGGASFGTEHRERALALLLRKYGGVDYDKHWGTTVHLIDDGADTKWLLCSSSQSNGGGGTQTDVIIEEKTISSTYLMMSDVMKNDGNGGHRQIVRGYPAMRIYYIIN